MKWLVRAGLLLLCILGGFMAIPKVQVGSGEKVSSSVRYVALGDSIAKGYGLRNPEEDSYVGQVCQYLEGEYDHVVATNFGVNGMDSDDLLDALTNPQNESYRKYRATLQYADIVTVSIGSNDLMHLVKLDVDMQEYIENGDRMFREACKKFDVNFGEIIQVIRRVSPRAEVYVNNVYNPAKGLSNYEHLYDLSEKYIDLLNQSFIKSTDFRVVDIKGGFDKSDEKLVNMAWSGIKIDPHPSKEGHRLIGEMVVHEIQKSELGREEEK